MAKISNHYILILCGGSGPRLWPLSRADHPKQFLKIFSSNSLLRATFLRAQKIVNRHHIYIITNQKYLSLVKKDLSRLADPKNIITEPEKKNTAMAILYGSAIISSLNPQAVITTFTADHFIGQLSHFYQTVIRAFQIASAQDTIVTIGIKPTSPSTSFGYLQTSTPRDGQYPVKTFIEKPPLESAIKLIQSKQYYWNSGIYTFHVNTLISEFRTHAKQYVPLYEKIYSSINSPKIIAKMYSLAPGVSIDVAISEKSKKLSMILADFVWNDVGEWKSIYQQLSQNNNHIATLNHQTTFYEIGSKNCLLSGQPNKLIGLIDVSHLAIIDTPDAMLICNMDNGGSYKVRDLITKIVKSKKHQDYFLKSYDPKKT